MACSRQLDLVIRSWGGRRGGAGRKPTPGRRRMPHRRRALHDPHCPVHVTLRTTPGLASLRAREVFPHIQRTFGAVSGASFRLLQFSVQSDHLHLLVEADTPTRLARGMQGLAARTAKAINRVLHRRGTVWAERYHAHALKTRGRFETRWCTSCRTSKNTSEARRASTRAPLRRGSRDGIPQSNGSSAGRSW